MEEKNISNELIIKSVEDRIKIFKEIFEDREKKGRLSSDYLSYSIKSLIEDLRVLGLKI